MTSTTKTRRIGPPLTRELATFTLIILYCVHSVNCSKIHTQAGKYNEHDLFGELYDVSVDEDEGRTFSVSNISLVITYVTFIVGLTMLAGFIWLAFSAGGGDSHGGYGYNRRIFTEGISDWLFSGFNFFEHDGNYKRQKRSTSFEFRDQAMASKLHMLDESFRKFEMDDLGCQMLLACESAQLETMEHGIYGDLTQKIHKFLSSAKSSRQSKSGTRVEKLLQAHREGRKVGSSCKKLYGGLCHNLMEKMDKAEEEDKARINASLEKEKENGNKQANQEKKDNLSFWEKKSKMAKLDMDKKMMMKKKKYRMKY